MSLPRIAVLGDPMFDVWHEYMAVRPNPEAPQTSVAVPMGPSYRSLGGAANVAANLASLGHPTRFVTTLSYAVEDLAELRDLCSLAKIELSAPTTPNQAVRISQKHRYLVDGTLQFRTDRDTDPRSGTKSPVNVVRVAKEALLDWADCLVFVDYAKGALPPGFVKVLSLLWNGRTPILLDAKPDLHLAMQDQPFEASRYLKMNRLEADHVEAAKTAAHWQRATSAAGAVITHGGQGIDWATPQQTEFFRVADVPAPRSVVGAGDVLTAALASAIAQGEDFGAAVREAARMATATVASDQARTLVVDPEWWMHHD